MEHPPLITASHSVCSLMPETQAQPLRAAFRSNSANPFRVASLAHSHRKPPKNLRYPRRVKVPPDPGIYRVPLKQEQEAGDTQLIRLFREDDNGSENDDDSVWSPEELEAISALFERRTPPKPARPERDRPLPLPLPYKARPAGIPTPKRHVRPALSPALSSRSSFSDRVRKNPEVLIGIAREIGALPPDADASEVLDGWAPFLRKGSLSMTIRELGHMGLPERALQTLCWAQKHRPELFPDDRILASAVEVLARSGRLKMESQLEEYLNSASRSVVEAMARGFIRAGNLHRAQKLLLLAKDSKRTLDPSIHAKLILEAGRNPDGYRVASALLDELGEREHFDVQPQDCTALMKVCIKLRRFEAVESLFSWFKESGRIPTIVMYTTVIYSRYCDKKYREAMALVWEVEGLDCLLDLPAYRVVIRLCVALDDLARAARYYSRLKEAGFAPTYDIYRDMIKAYAASGRLAKCQQVCKEVEAAGLKLDKETISLLSKMEGEKGSVF